MTPADLLRYKRAGLQGIMVVTEHFTRPDFWRSRVPGFHIGDAQAWRSARPFRYGNEEADDLGGRIRQEGYFRLRHDFGTDLAILAATVRGLSADGIPPVFAFVYDEFWALFQALDSLYGGLLGPYGYLPDFWIWNVDPQNGDAGWTPHRDKGYASLRADGSPISLTTWIPLSDATPLNSCMYLVPADADPTYGTPREAEWRFELPSVRALPAAPGDVLVWNQAVLHWGSRSSWRETQSRVSIAFEFQATDTPAFNRPLLPSSEVVPFETRLALIGKQIMQYRHMYRIDPAIEHLAEEMASSLNRS
jgi:hypothetical protein